jgi:chromosome segregation ATPase
MKQTLAPSEIEGYKKFISLYEEFSKDIQKYQEGLEKIEEEKNNLMKSLKVLTEQVDKTRLDEAAYNDKLIAKYGPFSMNVETFEITINEEDK